MDKMRIEIWSDVACPYCYIGKRKLEAALSEFSYAKEIDLDWRSYELNPSLMKKPLGKTYYQYLASVQHITEDEAKEKAKEVSALAKESELSFDMDKLVVTNTSDALRLVKLAKKYNLGSEAEEILFDAYFAKGEDISDVETLTLLGNKIGIPRADIQRMLDSHEYSEEIRDDINMADNELDLQFIPYYLLNGKYVIQGSVDVKDYLNTIEIAFAEWKENGRSVDDEKTETITGQSCSIDGVCD